MDIKENLSFLKFLAAKCTDGGYPPLNDLYLNFNYGQKITLKEVQDNWRGLVRDIKKNKKPPYIGIYIHWPFCPTKCTYCFCDSLVPTKKEMDDYLHLIKKELLAFKNIVKGIALDSIYFGGGTPSFMQEEAIKDLFAFLHKNFSITAETIIYLEGSPFTLSESKLKLIRNFGATRLTIGCQSLDPKVLKKINRSKQNRGQFKKIFLIAKQMGFIMNVDLVGGLEGQTKGSLLKDIKFILELKPDVLHIHSFDPRPYILFSQMNKSISLDQRQRQNKMFSSAKELITRSGYILDRTMPESKWLDKIEDRQDMNYNRFFKTNSGILGVGCSALSHVFGHLFYYHPPTFMMSKPIDFKKIPDFIGVKLNQEEEMRHFIISHFSSRKSFSRQSFMDIFGKDIKKVKSIMVDLEELELVGKIKIKEKEIEPLFVDHADCLIYSKYLFSDQLLKKLWNVYKKDFFEFIKKNPFPQALDDLLQNSIKKIYHSACYYLKEGFNE